MAVTSTRVGEGEDGPRLRGFSTPPRLVVARRALTIVAASVATDLLAVTFAYLVAGEARITRLHDFPTDPIVVATIPCWLAVIFAYGMYSRRHVLEPALPLTPLISAVTVSTLLTIVIAFATGIHLSRAWVAGLWILGTAFLLADRFAVLKVTEALHRAGWLGLRTLVVGNNGEARTFARVLRKKRHLGYDVVGFVSEREGPIDNLPVLAKIAEIRAAVVESDVAAVFIAGSDLGAEALNQVDTELDGLNVRIRTTLGLPHLAASHVVVREVDGMAMLGVERVRPSEFQLRMKRALDMTMATAGLVFGAPVLAAIAVAIKLHDRGPVIFAQRRVGEGGEHFTMYKFRTMVTDAESLRLHLVKDNEADGALFKMRRDPRVTPVGRHLRRLGLDELPQLVNVLLGEMSLVGPRPALPEEMEGWPPEVMARLEAKPGLTGLWQVSGRHELVFEDYVRYDLFYVQNWSFWLDLQIIARTIPALLSRAGAY
jgi:exopolysaccharide biosynthesis polyprenyl glycosylphosphotransferase